MSGIDTVVAGLGSREAPLIWLKFDQHDSRDVVSQGNKFADAVSRALGSSLIGHGYPLAYGVEVLARFIELLGPFTIVVSNAHLAPVALLELRRLSAGATRLIVVADTARDMAELMDESVLDQSALLLTLDEAAEIAEGVEPDRTQEMWRTSGRRYVPFQIQYRSARCLPPLLVPEPVGATFEGAGFEDLEGAQVFAALRSRGAWADALEYAVKTSLPIDDELAAKAGQDLFDRGLHRRLFNLLRGLGSRARRESEEIMRWYFSAATAIGEHDQVKAEVQEFLSTNEAPDVRALFAGAFPGVDLLQETSRALSARRTPLTLRMHAFALTQCVGGNEAAGYLMTALRQAEVLGLDDTVVACATDLADFWVKRGSYVEGAEWAKWAVDWHVKHGLRDALRRKVAVSLGSFARILVGDILGLQSAIDEIDVRAAGVPTSESTISTRADWLFVEGDLRAAAELYRTNLNNSQLGQFHHAALDLVHCLAAQGTWDEAATVARRARMLTRRSDLATRGLGDLALGVSVSREAPESAVELLAAAQGVVTEAPRLAQATIALAKVHLRLGREDAARRALEVGEHALKELAWTGWKLLGGFDPEVKVLYDMFRGETNDLELHFLGGERLVYKGEAVELGLRQCECLVVLASRPDGVAAERLGLDVYGETAHFSTLKAIVSRLRQVVPIESKPYRIAVPAWADFVEMERLVSSGRVREAMSLYRGPLLPRSQAPAVVELREHLEEIIRHAVLASGDVEALLQLAKITESDLELYEAALERISTNDPRFPVVRARLDHVRRAWAEA